MLSLEDRRLIHELQGDLPLTLTPYGAVGEAVGITEQAVIEKILKWKHDGVIRRVGAVIRHQQVGRTYNVMSVWNVPEARVDEVGRLLASYPEITHCYERPTSDKWPYNLFAMIHCSNEAECNKVISSIVEKTGIRDYCLLLSTKEYKKESLQFF
jgi:DNA-binding Lrp family transcriptional regulator